MKIDLSQPCGPLWVAVLNRVPQRVPCRAEVQVPTVVTCSLMLSCDFFSLHSHILPPSAYTLGVTSQINHLMQNLLWGNFKLRHSLHCIYMCDYLSPALTWKPLEEVGSVHNHTELGTGQVLETNLVHLLWPWWSYLQPVVTPWPIDNWRWCPTGTFRPIQGWGWAPFWHWSV